MSDARTNAPSYPARTWRLPPLDTMYLCDDGYYRSLGDLLEELDELEIPTNDEDLLFFLSLYGIDWTRPVSPSIAERDKALRAKWVREIVVPEMPDYPAQITGEM